VGCEQSSEDGGTARSVPFEPRAVEALKTLELGDVWFSMSIGDDIAIARVEAVGDSTTLQLAPGAFDGSARRVVVEFFLDAADGTLRPLARGSRILPPPGADGQVLLSGLFYDYTDTDGDGLFDVHELAESPADMDFDGLGPVDDPDSDGDGLRDGDDPTPYGQEEVAVPIVATLRIEIAGVDERVEVERIVGGREETRRLAATGMSLPLRTPAQWPFGAIRTSLEGGTWSAWEPGAGTDALCPNWSVSIDATSFATSLSNQALLIFRREETGTAFVAPVSVGTVEDLDVFEHAGPLDGDGPWNDGLRVSLVRSGTVAGSSCTPIVRSAGVRARSTCSTP